MKIILQTDVFNLGKAGEIKEVSPGYARNYLFPKSLALTADEENIRLWEEKKKLAEKKELKKFKQAEELAQKLEKVSCTITVKSGEEEKIFGAVNNADIAEELSKQGINIDKKDILLPEPIRHLGAYIVEVQVHQRVTAKLKLWVVSGGVKPRGGHASLRGETNG
jgi:large subunit ribosomal protein L9